MLKFLDVPIAARRIQPYSQLVPFLSDKQSVTPASGSRQALRKKQQIWFALDSSKKRLIFSSLCMK